MPDYNFSVNLNEYLPLRDVVFNTLRNAILSGKLLPGERLMENHLASKLGVSRTPIREALRMLELENLVELVPRKGAQVLDISQKDIINVLEVRGTLEALGVKLACERMSYEQLERLKQIQNEFIVAHENQEYDEAADADEKFHELIFESTNNVKLIQMVNNLKIQIYRYRLAYLKVSGVSNKVVEDHFEIIRSIENQLSENGAAVALEHVNHQAEVIVGSLK